MARHIHMTNGRWTGASTGPGQIGKTILPTEFSTNAERPEEAAWEKLARLQMVEIAPENPTIYSVTGIIVGNSHILSCGHFHGSWIRIPGLSNPVFYKARRLADGMESLFCLTAASSFDVSMLSADSFLECASDGPTCDAIELVAGREELPPIHPCRVDLDDCATLGGKFFSRKRDRFVPVEMTISPNQFLVHLRGADLLHGDSGGPLFTLEGNLIGCVTTAARRSLEELEGYAILYYQSLPVLAAGPETISWIDRKASQLSNAHVRN